MAAEAQLSTRDAVIELAQCVGQLAASVKALQNAVCGLLPLREHGDGGFQSKIMGVRDALAESEQNMGAAYQRAVEALERMGLDA